MTMTNDKQKYKGWNKLAVRNPLVKDIDNAVHLSVM
jgi:hypothetical protein